MEVISEESMLWIYRKYKRKMKEEDYAGGEKDRILFRAKTTCLWLQTEEGRKDVKYVEVGSVALYFGLWGGREKRSGEE